MAENVPASTASTAPPGRFRAWVVGPRKKLWMPQANMKRVLLALTPLLLAAIYHFGWRVLAVLVAANLTGVFVEWLTSRSQARPISYAVFVTCGLYALSLPPTAPFGVAVVGAAVAVLFGKEVFGGFGRNFANPAIVGRAFVYICFPVPLTAQFVPAFRGLPGGFAHWSLESLGRLPDYLAATGKGLADAVTQASPMFVYRDYQILTPWWDLLTGNIGGTFLAGQQTRILAAGSAGEGCAILILLAAVYLLATRTANWRLMLGGFAGAIGMNVLFRNVLGFAGAGGVPPLHLTLLAGTTLYVLVFMVTDPVSAPSKKPAQLAYGLLIGAMIVLLRWRGVFVAAASFSVLLGNLIGPLLDLGADWFERRRNPQAQSEGEGAGG